MSSQVITELAPLEAKQYFRESKHYVNFELPYYFNFDQLLIFCNAAIDSVKFNDLCIKDERSKIVYPRACDQVNHTVLANKDGLFAWRPMEIIHPILYCDLLNLITEEDNWTTIINLFDQYQKSDVRCISLPRRSNGNESDKASQIRNWWEKLEQESLKKALDYKFIFVTDITNCYGSIYTHSFEWAFHESGRLGVKEVRAEGHSVKNLGSEIDIKLSNMNQGQTIGIPQGSTLMDLMAEIVLGGIDTELTHHLRSRLKTFTKPYEIIRFRDDYRIFTNDFQQGHEIMKLLSSTLHAWGMRMNSSKTTESDDLISSSIKSEKLSQIQESPMRQYYQKEALRIYKLSQKHPNSGLIATELGRYYDRLDERRVLKHVDHEVVISIITMIAYYSPKYIPQVSAIISKIMEKSADPGFKKAMIKKIHNKFQDIPNTGLVDIWLQRIAAPLGVEMNYQSILSDAALNKIQNTDLWNSQWLRQDLRDIINMADISTLENQIESDAITAVIERPEFEVFRKSYF